jgi:hypothetical protein
MNSSTIPSNSELDRAGREWSTPPPGRIPRRKDTVPIVYRGLGGPPLPAWKGAENRPSPGFDPQTFQPAA